jgi:F-type H+-transporting ATPase subunit b
MFDINPGLIIWTIIVFVILSSLLGRFAWRPLLSALKEREDNIRGALDKAEQAKTEAEEMIRKNQENMAKAEEEYQRMVREAKAMAEKMKEDIVAKANEQARHDLQKAQEEIQRSVEEARQTLRAEVADLAIQATEKILDETLDASKQKKVVDAFINQLPKN